MDSSALKSLILEHLKDLRRFAYSLTNNISDADDLTQTVVEKLLTKPIPENVAALPWMFRVCKNAWIDEIRSRKVRHTDESVDLNEIAVATSDDSSQEIQQTKLKAAIMELPDTHRDVITLIVISGRSYAETAEVLEIPIGTVMSRVARAREKLALTLNQVSGEY